MRISSGASQKSRGFAEAQGWIGAMESTKVRTTAVAFFLVGCVG
jgi:hypothetical protein